MIPLLKKVALFAFVLMLTACVKKNINQQNQNTLVPNVNVNTSVNADFISLVGQFTTDPGQGKQGIIVFNIDGTNFKAFDLACPYIEPSKCNVPMKVNQGTGEMSCAGCANDSIKFTQYKTGVTVGKTKYYLKQYYARREGNTVIITNF